jgi:hypothetical protein
MFQSICDIYCVLEIRPTSGLWTPEIVSNWYWAPKHGLDGLRHWTIVQPSALEEEIQLVIRHKSALTARPEQVCCQFMPTDPLYKSFIL